MEKTFFEISEKEKKNQELLENFETRLTDNGYIITGLKNKNLTDIIIPDNVIGIGNNAFVNCTNIVNITIPDSVINIYSPFNHCTKLASIKVDKNNPKYDSRNNCNAIIETENNSLIAGCKNTIIPNNVKIIENSAFFGCTDLIHIAIPDSIEIIKDFAFYDCKNLITMVIPDSITYIGDEVFENCKELTIIISKNLNIGYDAFNNCKELVFCNDIKNVNWNENFYIESTESEHVIIRLKNKKLTDIVIPDNITGIGNSAFCNCSEVTNITIPDSITYIGSGAFSYCNKLESIKVSNNNKIYDSRNNCNAIIETQNNTLILGCKNTIIPNSVTSIGDCAFCGSTGLINITIPYGVTIIGEAVFNDCSNLESINIPDSVISIGSFAFENCKKLKDVTIPDGIISIDNYAFAYCEELVNIDIPDSIEFIGMSAFVGCKNLIITIPENFDIEIDVSFYGCKKIIFRNMNGN